MKKITVKDINILYNDENIVDSNKILNILSNNYDLFKSFLPNNKIITLFPCNDKNCIYINDFEDFSRYVFENYYKEIKNSDFFKQNLALVFLRFRHIINKYQDNNMDTFFNFDDQMDKKMLNDFTIYAYFSQNNDIDGFVNFMINNKDINTIISFLMNNTRYLCYNYVILKLIQKLKNDNFEDLDLLVYTAKKDLLLFFENPDMPFIKYDNMSFNEIDTLFINFLKWINAPESWFSYYDDFKKNKNIIFSNDAPKSICTFDNNKLEIIINDEKNINNFISLVHEFIHAMMFMNNSNLSSHFSDEFPSIYFENLVKEYLDTLKIDTNYLMNFRFDNNASISYHLLPIFEDLVFFKNNGCLLNKDKIKQERKYKNLYYSNIKRNDFEETIHMNMDKIIDSYILDGFNIFNSYKYLVASYLTDQILKKDNYVINDIIYDVINNKNDYTFEEMLDKFDINHQNCSKMVRTKRKY